MPLKYLSFVTLFITFLLIILGGIVHNTGSSLACPDWPLCYGQFFPRMEGGILIEHGHRLLGSLVGFLTIMMVLIANKDKKEKPFVFKLTILALIMVIIQGILGGITVIYKLPTIVSTAHLGLSIIFFCTLILINHQSFKFEHKDIKNTWNPDLKLGILFVAGSVYLQILLGAFMRHSGAGATCGLGTNYMLKCLQGSTSTWWPSLPIAQLHMSHRIFAVIVFFFAVYFLGKSVKYFWKSHKRFVVLPLLIIAAILGQIILGLLTIGLNMSIVPTTAHLALAAICLGLLWKYYLSLKTLESSLFEIQPITKLSSYLNLTKPRLSALVVVTALVGIISAPGEIYFFKALGAVVWITLTVAGACALNCYIERNIDLKMKRTMDRPLPAGRLKSKQALIFGLVLLLISLPPLFIWINFITGLLAGLAAFLYLFVYTPLKQKSEWAVLIGAIPGAIPPLLGVTSVTGQITEMGIALFAILFVWQLPHFLAISLLYEDDYTAAGIKVFPNVKGVIVTSRKIFYFSCLLFFVALIPWFLNEASLAYRNSAFVLGAALILFALRILRGQGETEILRLARNYFYFTLLYLPLLLGSLVFFK
ncbi:MAG: protoheme IX farnesyltransferase [Epsilonproteobacteria bacterium]|nr:MAG: protoheme IX farnesyltransferase [Campylobacterota bacterium]RLA67460.1 MAG: protoheme IX farnesyltransferase [Campylobacterota bacterium]